MSRLGLVSVSGVERLGLELLRLVPILESLLSGAAATLEQSNSKNYSSR